jgi:AraC-like DNA-binding protein
VLDLTLTCLRSRGRDDIVQRLLRGDLHEALPLAMARLDRRPAADGTDEHVVIGQLAGRALLILGREEEAEDVFRRQLRLYENGHRSQLRWLSSLDQGAMQLALNRPARAAAAYNSVADDEGAPTELRLEALAGLAGALCDVGEHLRAERTLQLASQLAARHGDETVQRLLHGRRLECEAMRAVRRFDDEQDACAAQARAGGLREDLLQAAAGLDAAPAARQRLRFLAALLDATPRAADFAAPIVEHAAALRRARAAGHEKGCRIEGALVLLARGEAGLAQSLLEGLARDVDTARRDRHSIELLYCLSRIHVLQGRHVEALHSFREHATRALARVRAELAQLPYSRFLEKLETADVGSPMKLALPLRYRRAYQYVLEHLDDRELSVREIAAHIDVTERALQMAFRSHLGLTPGEFIRRKRMERIRRELREAHAGGNVLAVAQRWGLSNRSTLTQNYRQQFNETPTEMLRGGAALGAAEG